MAKGLTRRRFLAQGALVGCSLAASPLITQVSFAAAPTDHRLVVIILRGGLDGLDLVRPRHEKILSTLRPTLAASSDSEIPLQDGFALHPECAPLYPMWQAGELAFVQAVSTPYRDKRSHFDGQDLLEAGLGALDGPARDGWLNRAISAMGGMGVQTAYAIGADPMLLSRGPAEMTSWSPDVDFVLSEQGISLMQQTMRGDPEMAHAMGTALGLASFGGMGANAEIGDMEEAMDAMMDTSGKGAGKAHLRVASFAAEQLRADARIACFSLGGWDTHAGQSRALRRPLGQLVDTLLTLKGGMGAAAWQRTTVVAMTEFGRTAAENGTRGTDHGTGGAMVLAGGALRGAAVLGKWPGLDEADLYKRRDLRPTQDVRRWAAWALRSSFGLERSLLETQVFPGLDMGDDPKLLA
ncbi:uncharacterized protein (DUF1501 family) [Shimia isoporae]|uniref:Uncharacterized protein (DUF1501 family) n=1 Tax=Shimia isoporae TaxID=647720 RepID=A0A4V2Q3W8_9RHOB|nr:DUF1501 domain-containing protein [Shimia isoporae]TCL08840.1 uncharacterized protein (DUF1501 family) [Shimia isoporae]